MNNIQQLKTEEATLLKILFDYKLKLWESQLSHNDKEEIESRFNLLEKITFEIFKNKYDNIRNPAATVGNI